MWHRFGAIICSIWIGLSLGSASAAKCDDGVNMYEDGTASPIMIPYSSADNTSKPPGAAQTQEYHVSISDMTPKPTLSDAETRMLTRRQAQTLTIAYLPPQLDGFYQPLPDLFRVVVDDLQAQGVLAGTTITMVAHETLNERPRIYEHVMHTATTENAIGVLSVGGSWADDRAFSASIYNLPNCEGAEEHESLSSSGDYPTTFRVIPDFIQMVLAFGQWFYDMGWEHHVALLSRTPELNSTAINDLMTNPPLFVQMVPTTATYAPSYAELLQTVKNSRFSIIHSELDGPTLLNVLRTAKTMNMLDSYVWIINYDSYLYIMSIINATEYDIIEGAFVIQPPLGTGPIYDSLKSRWNTLDFQAKYPLLQTVEAPKVEWLPLHTCLDLMLRGFDRFLQQNPNITIAELSKGFQGTALSQIKEPDTFSFPEVDTVLGKVIFEGNTRLATFTLSYVESGHLHDFATTTMHGPVNYTGTISWRGSSTKPADLLSEEAAQDDTSFWVRKVIAPIVAVFGFLLLVGCGLYYRQWKRRRRMEEDIGQLKPLGHFPRLDIRGPAQKAMELLQSAKDPTKKTKLTSQDIDFIIEVLTNNSAFNPNFDKMGMEAAGGNEGVQMDDETRAWVMDILAASPSSHAAGGTSTSPNSVSRQSSDSANGIAGSAPGSTSLVDNQNRRDSKAGRRSSVMRSALSIPEDPSEANDTVGLPPASPGSPPVNLNRPRRGSTSNARKMSIMVMNLRPPGPSSADTDNTATIPSAASTNINLGGSKPLIDRIQDATKQSLPKELDAIDQVKIMDYLTVWYHSWNFDMFQFTEMTNGHPLFYSGVYILQTCEPLGRLGLDTERFKRWLLLMEAEYHPHPYHNATHAADVLHALNYLLIEDPIATHYTPLEVLALVLAAIGHDIDHPGFNNSFLVKSGHPWAILYCDNSVLEYHHCAHLFSLTLSSPWNIFSDLRSEEYDELRKIVIRLILATDMNKHFEYINKFKTRQTGGAANKLDVAENRYSVAEIAIKCSDLCNPTKTFALSSKWTEAVMEEFYLQGDKERELGMSISQFMDRANTNVPKCQIGFIDILVAPLYDAWNTFHNSQEKTNKIFREIGKNRANWASLTASQQLHQQQGNASPPSASAGTSQVLGASNTSIPTSRHPSNARPGGSNTVAYPQLPALNASGVLPMTNTGDRNGSLPRGKGDRTSDTIRDKGGIIMNTGDIAIDGAVNGDEQV